MIRCDGCRMPFRASLLTRVNGLFVCSVCIIKHTQSPRHVYTCKDCGADVVLTTPSPYAPGSVRCRQCKIIRPNKPTPKKDPLWESSVPATATGTAPCGHKGEHIFGNYVRCMEGCEG